MPKERQDAPNLSHGVPLVDIIVDPELREELKRSDNKGDIAGAQQRVRERRLNNPRGRQHS
jgi:hypothetical protein